MTVRNPSDKVLRSVLMEAESIINSRPLTHVSVEHSDDEALTPNHILLRSSKGNYSPREFSDREFLSGLQISSGDDGFMNICQL